MKWPHARAAGTGGAPVSPAQRVVSADAGEQAEQRDPDVCVICVTLGTKVHDLPLDESDNLSA